VDLGLFMAIKFNLVTADALMSLDFETLLSRVEVRDCFSYGNALSQLAQDEAKWSPAQLESIRFVAALLMMGLRAPLRHLVRTLWALQPFRSAHISIPVFFSPRMVADSQSYSPSARPQARTGGAVMAAAVP